MSYVQDFLKSLAKKISDWNMSDYRSESSFTPNVKDLLAKAIAKKISDSNMSGYRSESSLTPKVRDLLAKAELAIRSNDLGSADELFECAFESLSVSPTASQIEIRSQFGELHLQSAQDTLPSNSNDWTEVYLSHMTRAEKYFEMALDLVDSKVPLEVWAKICAKLACAVYAQGSFSPNELSYVETIRRLEVMHRKLSYPSFQKDWLFIGNSWSAIAKLLWDTNIRAARRNDKGNADIRLFHLEKAESLIKETAKLIESRPGDRLENVFSRDLGKLYVTWGSITRDRGKLEDGLRLLRTAYDQDKDVVVLTYAVPALIDLGVLSNSEVALQDAHDLCLDILADPDATNVHGDTHLNRGQILQRLGEWKADVSMLRNAEVAYQEAIDCLSARGPSKEWAIAVLNLSQLSLKIFLTTDKVSDGEAAVTSLTHAAEFFDKAGRLYDKASVFSALGNLYVSMGSRTGQEDSMVRGIDVYRKAIELYRQSNETGAVASLVEKMQAAESMLASLMKPPSA
jgi:tetratricopeptide (TPR) repeat protein